MNFGQRYIFDQLTKTAGVLDPALLGPCHGTNCPTCTHFDEQVEAHSKTTETQKPSKSDKAKAKHLKTLKKHHQKGRSVKSK